MKMISETNDFKELIEGNYLYIDKTLLIKEIIDNGDKAICLPRPRRFGKTLNMSMLYYYFSSEFDSHDLFKGLNISKSDDKYLSEMNKYPVIFLTLKETKKDTYEEFINKYKTIMSDLYKKYKFILENSDIDKEFYNKIINKEEDGELPDALSYLIRDLKKYYDNKVIVLLDEYDVPILEGYEKGYYDKIVNFMRQLFVTTFKDNNNLKKGIITGMLRVSKEGLMTGANNVIVYGITENRFSEYFGFLESEVKYVLKEYNLSSKYADVKKWYDGYLFGKSTIYNPWSIINFLRGEGERLESFWVNTGGVGLLKNLIYNLNNKMEILNSYERLLKNGYIEHIWLNTNLDINTLVGDIDNIYTLFMLAGYLTPVEYITNPRDVTLRIPNLEIRENLERMVTSWFRSGPLKEYNFTEYLIGCEIESFKKSFQDIVLKSFSYFDVPDNKNGENFYHAFTMGLLMSSSNNYEIKSNRESGYGRYDLVLKPIDGSRYAYIIEFKVVDSDFDKTIEDGFKQIEENKYDISLKDYDVTKMVIAFKGKRVKIETRN